MCAAAVCEQDVKLQLYVGSANTGASSGRQVREMPEFSRTCDGAGRQGKLKKGEIVKPPLKSCKVVHII